MPALLIKDVGLIYLVGEAPHRRQILQVELTHLDLAGCGAGHAVGGGLALSDVAHGQDDVSTDPGQFSGGHLAQTAVGAGDDGGAPGERGQVRCGPIWHCHHTNREF